MCRITRGAVFVSRTLHTNYYFDHQFQTSCLFPLFRVISQPCNKNAVPPRCIAELTQCVINVLAAVIHLSLCRRCPWHIILYSLFMSPTSLALYFVLHFVTDVLGTIFYPSLCHWCPWHYIMSFIMSLMSLALYHVLHYVSDVLGTTFYPSFCH